MTKCWKTQEFQFLYEWHRETWQVIVLLLSRLINEFCLEFAQPVKEWLFFPIPLTLFSQSAWQWSCHVSQLTSLLLCSNRFICASPWQLFPRISVLKAQMTGGWWQPQQTREARFLLSSTSSSILFAFERLKVQVFGIWSWIKSCKKLSNAAVWCPQCGLFFFQQNGDNLAPVRCLRAMTGHATYIPFTVPIQPSLSFAY